VRVLLDTCVVSELRRPDCHASVRKAIKSLESDDIFLSVITVGEISKGIALLKDSRRRRHLELWLRALERDHASRILSIDVEVCRTWGNLTASAQKRGKTIPATDGLIAATARQHGLHIMTRNVEHFNVAGILVVNPWS
jgi:toxin FitB